MTEPTVWLGATTCDFCRKTKPAELVDGKTKRGPWAVMCMDCFKVQGVGLGTGRGQHYKHNGKYLVKIEG